MTSRTESLRAMLARNPSNALARFGLANELVKEGAVAEAVEHYRQYLTSYDDEGNGYGRLAESLVRLGDLGAAREAFRKGIAAAHRFGHPGMASEFEARLEELDDA